MVNPLSGCSQASRYEMVATYGLVLDSKRADCSHHLCCETGQSLSSHASTLFKSAFGIVSALQIAHEHVRQESGFDSCALASSLQLLAHGKQPCGGQYS